MTRNQYFRDKVKRYYVSNGRDFFWRRDKLTPFQILITELFLKKTRAETVEKYMYDFVKKFRNNKKFLIARKNYILKQVLPLGLGNQRAGALLQIRAYIHENLNDTIPPDVTLLMKIPHVGLYIANATLCFAFDIPSPVIDVNTSRIISRFYSIDNTSDLRENHELQKMAIELLPRENIKKYTWGLLDIGATLCKTEPVCLNCLLRRKCDYFNKNQDILTSSH